jgi:uncharacterized RDD family membrane protein YckC
MSNKIIPLKIEGIDNKIYSGFWSRLGANLLDGLITIPFIFLLLFINSFNKNMYFFTTIPNLLFIFWYNIYLVKKYGGTPGKLIIGIKIIKIDSLPINWKEAFLRYSINFLFSIIMISNTMITVLFADNEIYNNLNWIQKSVYLSNISSNYNIITVLNNIWFLSELVVLLFNKRKRAIHDFIAGTVIIKSEYIEKVREKMEE